MIIYFAVIVKINRRQLGQTPMKRTFSIQRLRVLLAFLAVSAAFSSAAALQEVSVLNPSVVGPPDADGDSGAPIITPDGRYILFASTANNLALAGTNVVSASIPVVANVYLRDRLNGATTLVSVNLVGTDGGDANSFPTSLSTNGQYALFESDSTNLVANDTLYIGKVFLRDVVNGVTWLVSVTPGGTNGNGVSRGSTMTPDGRYVAFVSAATNLVAGDTNGIPDVFVRDVQLGTTFLASVGAMNMETVPGASTNSSEAPEITPDGRYVAFYSTATNLVPGITNSGEIYVRDLVAGTTTWASTNAQILSKLNGSGVCYNQAISDDGQYVAFEISSNNSYTSSGFILRNNLQTGFTDLVSTNAAVPIGPYQAKRSLNLTRDGQSIVYIATNGNASAVYLWQAQTGTNILVSGNLTNGVTPGANVAWPDVDPSGRYVVFYNSDTNLTGMTNGGDLFLRDTQAGTTTLVSVDTNGFNLAVDPGAAPALVNNGQCVAFESPHADLDGRNYYCDVFFRNVTNNASELVSVHAPALSSQTPNGPSSLWPDSVSTNGRYVAFASWANNLATASSNSTLNVFVRDMAEESTELASVGTDGLPGDNMSTEPVISGDGRYVAFASVAMNLVAGDTSLSWQIFARDREQGTNILVSVSTNGGFGIGDSLSPVISANGRYVLFTSVATNLAPACYAPSMYPFTAANLFLRDLELSQTWALTTNSVLFSSMTPDGHFIAFTIGGGAALYVWNSQTESLVYTNVTGFFTNVSISPDGTWLAYQNGTNLYAENLAAQTNCLINSGTFEPHAGLQFSSDDRFLTYAMSSTSSYITNSIYLYNMVSGTNLIVSQAQSGIAENGDSDSPAISPDGRFVAYRSYASNLVPGETNTVPELFLYDQLAQTNILVSLNLSGTGSGDNRSLMPVFSSDSLMLVFESWASDLAQNDFNAGSDVFALNIFALECGEYQTNAMSALQPEIIFQGPPGMVPGQSLLVVWPFNPAVSAYSIQFKDHLTDDTWQNLNGNMTVIGDKIYFTDPSPSASQRFYRISFDN
jgi:Tol biopolymer transport system component